MIKLISEVKEGLLREFEYLSDKYHVKQTLGYRGKCIWIGTMVVTDRKTGKQKKIPSNVNALEPSPGERRVLARLDYLLEYYIK